jgi:nickel-dependent lactate racemase
VDRREIMRTLLRYERKAYLQSKLRWITDFKSGLLQTGKSPEELVEASLDPPIGSAKLEEFVNGAKRPQGSESG